MLVVSSAPAIATVTTVTATFDADTTADRVPIEPSLFGVGSSSTGRTDSVPGGFLDVSGSDFLIGGIRTIVEPDSDLQKVYVPQWSLFIEFNVGAACQIYLSAKVRMRAEYNIREKKRLRFVVDEQAKLLKVTAVKLQNNNLVDQVHELEISSTGLQEKVTAYEDFIGQLEKFKMKKGGGAAISKAVKKGMQEGLSAGITHGVEDQRIIGAFASSLSLDISHSRVRKIKQNIASHVSALHGVFVSLFEPLFVAALEGTILPISTDDYEVAHADGQEGASVDGETTAVENINPFLMLAMQS
nr:hypothetical protein [Tanacetum cinerariifolium]